jgi:hypothetical protein
VRLAQPEQLLNTLRSLVANSGCSRSLNVKQLRLATKGLHPPRCPFQNHKVLEVSDTETLKSVARLKDQRWGVVLSSNVCELCGLSGKRTCSPPTRCEA